MKLFCMAFMLVALWVRFLLKSIVREKKCIINIYVINIVNTKQAHVTLVNNFFFSIFFYYLHTIYVDIFVLKY